MGVSHCLLGLSAVVLLAYAAECLGEQAAAGRSVGEKLVLCGPVCAIHCPYGNVPDERGCPTCDCKPAPTRCALDPVPCAIRCAYGLKKDANGCQLCECNPGPPVCEPAVCPTIKCAYGLKKDANGCEICECNPFPRCPLVRCSRRCKNGYVYRNGCQTCICKPSLFPICPAVLCDLHCPNGFVVDERGCQTCRCKPERLCPREPCRRFCPNGFVYRDGCRTCECRPTLCATCKLGCPPGTELGPLDARGCPRCSCVPTGCNDQCERYCFTGRDPPSPECKCSCPLRRRLQPLELA